MMEWGAHARERVHQASSFMARNICLTYETPELYGFKIIINPPIANLTFDVLGHREKVVPAARLRLFLFRKGEPSRG
jgi:hypothetical protein